MQNKIYFNHQSAQKSYSPCTGTQDREASERSAFKMAFLKQGLQHEFRRVQERV